MCWSHYCFYSVDIELLEPIFRESIYFIGGSTAEGLVDGVFFFV